MIICFTHREPNRYYHYGSDSMEGYSTFPKTGASPSDGFVSYPYRDAVSIF